MSGSPRFAGSQAEIATKKICRERLEAAGFSVAEEPFSFSQVPARFGPFICGSIFIGGIFLSGHVAGAHHQPITAIAIALASVLAAALVGTALMKSLLTLPLWRASSSNLVATRGSAHPDIWLVAHTDSKSQTIGMLVRVASVSVTSVLFALMLATMALQAINPGDDLRIFQSAISSSLVMFAAIPFTLCFTTNRSRGALDNASGVAALLLALDAIPSERKLGVLLTSAEELALAGARAFVVTRSPAIALNCDTIDDGGRFICMTSGKGRRAAEAIVAGGKAVQLDVKKRGMISGILTDSIALADAGWNTCTLSRGNLGTLRRVHTSSDEPGRIDGTGIALAANILAASIKELS